MDRQLFEYVSSKLNTMELAEKKLVEYNKMGTLAKSQLGASLVLDNVMKTTALQIMEEGMVDLEEEVDQITDELNAYKKVLGRELSKEEISKFINDYPTLHSSLVKKKNYEERAYKRCMKIVERIEKQHKT